MSKVIISPVKKWPGTVTISDPLDIPQYLEVEKMIRERRGLDDGATWGQVQSISAPAVFACVEKWDLSGFPDMFSPEKFPMTPRAASIGLMTWLITEITALFTEAEEAPNA